MPTGLPGAPGATLSNSLPIGQPPSSEPGRGEDDPARHEDHAEQQEITAHVVSVGEVLVEAAVVQRWAVSMATRLGVPMALRLRAVRAVVRGFGVMVS